MPSEPGPVALRAGHVDIWRVSLDDHVADLNARRAVLTSQEVARADRFAFPEDHDLYVLTRGRLRTLLGGFLDVPPRSVRLRLGERGKPELDGPHRAAGVWFNVAHSGRLGCIAITMEGPVGVDVERIRPDVAGSGLAERFFSAPEVAALRRLATPDQERAFFECWTRKEAFIKALGTGLAERLDRFAVSLGPGCLAELRWVADGPCEPPQWTVSDVDVDVDYVAAMAIRAPQVSVGLWP